MRKDQQNDEILQFVKFWKERTGHLPEELIFDSKLTTYANLNRLNQQNIDFITLRRRSPKLLARSPPRLLPPGGGSNWKGSHDSTRRHGSWIVKSPSPSYKGPIRQLTILDLGHEEPTLLLTNQRKRSPAKLIGRYAQRMLIENNIADGVDFFHMDALSSAVAMKVNCDLQLTLMASSLYRLLATRIAQGYETAKSRHLFRDFVEATATIDLGEREIRCFSETRP